VQHQFRQPFRIFGIGLLPSMELLVGATLFVASLVVVLVVVWRAQRSGLMPAQ
jgi:hypothetical protein